MLRKGILAKADDRRQIAVYNSYCGEPVQWFDTEFFRNNNLFCITFDFFVDWKNHKIQKRLWTKRIIYKSFEMSVDEIYKKIVAVDGKDYLERLSGFCHRYDFELEYILCQDIPFRQWANPSNHVYIFNLTNYMQRRPVQDILCEVSADQLKEIIHEIRVECHSIGQKDLKYATSTLEVYLSQDKYIYPGDADIVLIDENYEAVAIIEVKKHTAYSEHKIGPLRQENLYNYRDVDKLKFQSLGRLKEHLGCALYMLYYSTVKGSREAKEIVKFERIVGNPQNLIAVYPEYLKLPNINNPYTLMAFEEAFCRYHREICRYDFDRIRLPQSYQAGTPISKADGPYLGYILDDRNKAAEKAAVVEFCRFAAGHIRGLKKG